MIRRTMKYLAILIYGMLIWALIALANSLQGGCVTNANTSCGMSRERINSPDSTPTVMIGLLAQAKCLMTNDTSHFVSIEHPLDEVSRSEPQSATTGCLFKAKIWDYSILCARTRSMASYYPDMLYKLRKRQFSWPNSTSFKNSMVYLGESQNLSVTLVQMQISNRREKIRCIRSCFLQTQQPIWYLFGKAYSSDNSGDGPTLENVSLNDAIHFLDPESWALGYDGSYMFHMSRHGVKRMASKCRKDPYSWLKLFFHIARRCISHEEHIYQRRRITRTWRYIFQHRRPPTIQNFVRHNLAEAFAELFGCNYSGLPLPLASSEKHVQEEATGFLDKSITPSSIAIDEVVYNLSEEKDAVLKEGATTAENCKEYELFTTINIPTESHEHTVAEHVSIDIEARSPTENYKSAMINHNKRVGSRNCKLFKNVKKRHKKSSKRRRQGASCRIPKIRVRQTYIPTQRISGKCFADPFGETESCDYDKD